MDLERRRKPSEVLRLAGRLLLLLLLLLLGARVSGGGDRAGVRGLDVVVAIGDEVDFTGDTRAGMW